MTKMGRGRVLLIGGALLGVSLVAGGGLVVMRAQQIARDAQERVVAIRESVAAEVAAPSAATAEEPVKGAAETVRKYCAQAGALERDLGPVTSLAGVAGPAAQLLGQLPAGERASALLTLAQAGAEIATATRVACDALDPVLEAQVAGADMAGLFEGLAGARPQLREATQRLRTAQSQMSGIDEQQLDETPRRFLLELRDKLPAATNRLALFAEVPGLLGFDGRRTYLILGQNTDEIFPTGGFIGTAGVVSIERGKVVRREYGSSVNYKLPPDMLVQAPAPLRPGMDEGYWHLYGANWWPDFPSSARQAQYFYELLDPNEPVAGVLAIDQHLIAILLEVTGPISVPQYDEVVSTANVRERLDYYTHVAGIGQVEDVRKNFVRVLFPLLMDRILNLPKDRMADLSGTLQRGFDEQHLMFWNEDARAQETISRLGWDARMLATSGDYLFPVSANLGANKINKDVEQSLEYEVSPGPDGRLVGRAVLHLRNRHPRDSKLPPWETPYKNYLRVYVPPQSELVSGAGFSDETETMSECGRTAFAGMVVVPPGEERKVELTYRLPSSLTPNNYSLLVQKQAGLSPFPLHLRGAGSINTDLKTDLGSHQLFKPAAQGLAAGPWVAAHQVPSTSLACDVHTAAPRILQPPSGLMIPKLDVNAEVLGLGADREGTLQSPPNGELVGWYVSSARPGQVGNSVMSGHVDWEKRTAVFWRLKELKKGDPLVVMDQGGGQHRYAVEWVKSYRAENAPLQEIIGGTSKRWLTLITCGGPFDPTTRDYTERLVVRASLTTGE